MKLRWDILLYAVLTITAVTAIVHVHRRPHSIKLQWVGTSELVQYNIYRGVDGGPFEKIGTSPFPTFEDKTVTPGHTYKYYTRAEDVNGHESGPSNAVVIGLP